jgi:hypothetical protein
VGLKQEVGGRIVRLKVMEREKEGGKFYITKESFDFLSGLGNK